MRPKAHSPPPPRSHRGLAPGVFIKVPCPTWKVFFPAARAQPGGQWPLGPSSSRAGLSHLSQLGHGPAGQPHRASVQTSRSLLHHHTPAPLSGGELDSWVSSGVEPPSEGRRVACSRERQERGARGLERKWRGRTAWVLGVQRTQEAAWVCGEESDGPVYLVTGSPGPLEGKGVPEEHMWASSSSRVAPLAWVLSHPGPPLPSSHRTLFLFFRVLRPMSSLSSEHHRAPSQTDM